MTGSVFRTLQTSLSSLPFQFHCRAAEVVPKLFPFFLENPSFHRAAGGLTIAAWFIVVVRRSSWFILLEGPCRSPNASVSRFCSAVFHPSCSSPAHQRSWPDPRRPSPARQCSLPASRRPSLSRKSLVTALAEGNASDAQLVLTAS
ncbi:hypothetical protein AHAS_Ahas16G0163400 [Arachis hypogaea]